MPKHAPFNGDYPVTTGWRYSSGSGHFAHDYPLPLKTPVFAVNDGFVLDCASGSPNDGPGDANYPGEPSNWVLLATHWKGKPVTVYYQHLSPRLKVRKGQKVTAGQVLGRSGNSGNSTGPHLHIAASHGHLLSRYDYMANDGDNDIVIFPPSDVWTPTEKQLLRRRLRNAIGRRVDRIRRLRHANSKDRKKLNRLS
jgi:murein DD-endopeptidase MepM/ murein hydrolase activator NlpD